MGNTANDVTSTIQNMINERFGVDVPEGYIYFSTDLGGLDLKNPFITLGLIQDSILKDPASLMTWFYQEEKKDYARAKSHFEKVIVPAREMLLIKELARDKFATKSFMSWSEFTRH